MADVGCRTGGDGRAPPKGEDRGAEGDEGVGLLSGKWRVLVHSGCYFCSNLKLY